MRLFIYEEITESTQPVDINVLGDFEQPLILKRRNVGTTGSSATSLPFPPSTYIPSPPSSPPPIAKRIFEQPQPNSSPKVLPKFPQEVENVQKAPIVARPLPSAESVDVSCSLSDTI